MHNSNMKREEDGEQRARATKGAHTAAGGHTVGGRYLRKEVVPSGREGATRGAHP